MSELVLPIAVLGMLLLFVDQVRRLVSHAILNRTIRRAMETDSSSVPLLIAKLEPRRRWPDALAGWIMFLAGAALASSAIFETGTEQSETLQIAAVGIILGVGVLAYSWLVNRSTPEIRPE